MTEPPQNNNSSVHIGGRARVTIAQGKNVRVNDNGGSGPKPPRRRILGWLAKVGGTMVAGVGVAALTGQFGGHGSTTPSPVAGGAGKTVTIDNRITVGPLRMSEDDALRLFTASEICRSDDCIVPGTSFYTGNKITGVVCQTHGAWVTNSDETTRADNRNPGRTQSRIWYGVRLKNGRMGYFSAVWAAKAQRDGMGLPDCRSNLTT
jgi:hypothetical protein